MPTIFLRLARNSGGRSHRRHAGGARRHESGPRDEQYVFHLARFTLAGKKWEAAGVLLDRAEIQRQSADRGARARPVKQAGNRT